MLHSILANHRHLLANMKELRLSILLSLAEYYKQEHDLKQALRFYYESLDIEYDNFNVWVKIGCNLEKVIAMT